MGTTPGAKEPAVFRPPPTSPSKRFAWRKQIKDPQGDGQDRDGLLPGCVKGNGYSGSAGENTKIPISNTMMKAYAAMRVGAEGLEASSAEPLLPGMRDQEVARELGAPT